MQTPQQYAAFRAECLKAEIEADSAAHVRRKMSPEAKRVKQRGYAATWISKHGEPYNAKRREKYPKIKDLLNAKRRQAYANKKAASSATNTQNG